ncbi:phenylacetic acid degradation protein [Donghicola tyrosinivorans]|uniref:Phenylacetic acid degradation protein n=2 Tax=Donghicola tyrosinivorans TaxID=1652492 RepID=A0A2T0WH85_9RHOB|nr:phenylacetic acid degradation protein [Donghicola tyrosinivorans]
MMGQVFAWDGVVPVVDPSAYIHPTAVLIGDVIVGAGCYVGPAAVLRGDFGRITMQAGSNMQETCVCHAFPGKDVVVEELGHIGHGAVLHGCHIGKNAMVGMNSVVMDDAVVGENTIVGAMAFVKANQVLPSGVMAVGSPARVLRELSAEEIDWKRRGTGVYQQTALEARTKLVRTQPLTAVEPDRRRVEAPKYDPLALERAAFNEYP